MDGFKIRFPIEIKGDIFQGYFLTFCNKRRPIELLVLSAFGGAVLEDVIKSFIVPADECLNFNSC